MLGLTTVCGQQNQRSLAEGKSNFESTDVQGFAELVADTNVVVLDVRTADEYAEGHIQGAVLIDQGQSDFMEKQKRHSPPIRPLLYIAEVAAVLLTLLVNWQMSATSV